jgi:uncharacterized iron-regulated membrane protein
MTEVQHPHSLSRQRKLRRWHRLVALVTSFQLLLWTLSGLYFAFIDIDYVRGHQFKRSASAAQLDLSSLATGVVSAKKVVIQERLTGELIVGVQTDDGIQWLDAQGASVEALTGEQALRLGAERTVIEPDQVEWIDTDMSGSEYRGAPLPLWRLWRAEDPDRVAYVDAMSGEVVVVRHDAWRWWDFLWSLHIMSYEDRDTIGTWLLKIFSVLALATAVLGLWLFLHTRVRRAR